MSAAGPITAHYNLVLQAMNGSSKGVVVNLRDVMISEKAKLISGFWPFQAACKPGMEGLLISGLCHHEATGEHPQLYKTYIEWTHVVRSTGPDIYDVALYVADNYTVGPLRSICGHSRRMLNEDKDKHYYECCVCFEKYTESTPVFECSHTVCMTCCREDTIDSCPLCRAPKEVVPEYTEEIKKKMYDMLNKLTKEIEKISDAEEMKRFAMLKALSQVDLDD
tara:strand:- start:317 stop:982 length:666 start_codon:yes stop_codon:yes gene_type:complete